VSTLLVLGGSGRTGIHVLEHAIARGHQVRALVRNPDAFEAPAGVQLITGTPANIDDIRRAAEGTEAVISVLNNARASNNPWAKPVSPPSFMTDAARATLTVMGEQASPASWRPPARASPRTGGGSTRSCVASSTSPISRPASTTTTESRH